MEELTPEQKEAARQECLKNFGEEPVEPDGEEWPMICNQCYEKVMLSMERDAALLVWMLERVLYGNDGAPKGIQ